MSDTTIMTYLAKLAMERNGEVALMATDLAARMIVQFASRAAPEGGTIVIGLEEGGLTALRYKVAYVATEEALTITYTKRGTPDAAG